MVTQKTGVCWTTLRRARGIGRALGLWLAIGSSALHHVPEASAQEDATQAAREAFRQGVTYFDQKQYDKARASFAQAYLLKRHPAVLLNLAQSELRSGKEADAAEHFAQFLRENKEAAEGERQSAEAGLSAAKAAALELTVSVDEDGATVLVDGSPKGTSPLPGPLYLSPGAHTVSAKLEEREASSQLNATAGQTGNLSLRVSKPAPAPKPIAPAPVPSQPAQAEARAEAPAPLAEESVGRPPFFRWVTSSPVGLVGAGLTVLGVGGGIGFAVGSRWAYNRADSDATQIRDATRRDGLARPDGICVDSALQAMTSQPEAYRNACRQYRDDVSQGDTFKTISIASWVVAGAAATGTLAYYFIAAKPAKNAETARDRERSVKILPVLGAAERGLLVVGQF
ncbi:MAG TPA: hypothetical protein VFQ61_37035 [Polyangiaceae bacterium]|nr:hypothetical protein [Polyangiaceae bacterium]